MTGGEILILGKAVIWFAIPLLFAWRELRLLKREREDTGRSLEKRSQAR